MRRNTAHSEDIELTALQRVALGFPASVIAMLRGTGTQTRTNEMLP